MRFKILFATASLTISLASTVAVADTYEVVADRDTAMFGPVADDLSSGAGTALFVGRRTDPGDQVEANTLLRSLIRFDVSGIPADAFVISAKVRIQVIRRPQDAEFPVPISFHRSLADWGESSSFSPGGSSAPAATGDATWGYRIFPTEPWDAPGGDFVAEVSGSAEIVGTGPYFIEGPGLAADVRSWIDGEPNDGWIMIGDESVERPPARSRVAKTPPSRCFRSSSSNWDRSRPGRRTSTAMESSTARISDSRSATGDRATTVAVISTGMAW